MKHFEGVITVEVAVNDIATKLLNTFPADYQHRELLTETLIGTAVNSNTLSYVYNALNGYSAEIDFTVGDIVRCDESHYSYHPWNEETGEISLEGERMPYGVSKVVSIDLYRPDKIMIQYPRITKDSKKNFKVVMDEAWVNHRSCTKKEESYMLDARVLAMETSCNPPQAMASNEVR